MELFNKNTPSIYPHNVWLEFNLIISCDNYTSYVL